MREVADASPLAGMSAGVVPVVINRGGLPEIVRHNENGFLAQTPEAIATLTAQVFLYSDPADYSRLQQAAVRDAKEFSAAAFAGNLQAIALDAAREKPFRHLIQSSSGKWPFPQREKKNQLISMSFWIAAAVLPRFIRASTVSNRTAILFEFDWHYGECRNICLGRCLATQAWIIYFLNAMQHSNTV